MRYGSESHIRRLRSFLFVISFFGLALFLGLPSKLFYVLSVNNPSDWSYLLEYLIIILFISTAIAFFDYIIFPLILDFFEGVVLFIISFLLLFKLHYSTLYIFLLGHFGMQDFYLLIGLTIFNFLILFKRIHSHNTYIDQHWDDHKGEPSWHNDREGQRRDDELSNRMWEERERSRNDVVDRWERRREKEMYEREQERFNEMNRPK